MSGSAGHTLEIVTLSDCRVNGALRTVSCTVCTEVRGQAESEAAAGFGKQTQVIRCWEMLAAAGCWEWEERGAAYGFRAGGGALSKDRCWATLIAAPCLCCQPSRGLQNWV